MKMYCVLLSVIFLMSLVTMVVSVGSSTRYYENGTSVTCLGIVCPLDEIFVPCTHSLGDGKHDTCEPCPSDRPRTLSAFDSSVFEDPPVYFVCKSVLERCECAEEAELVNPLNCTKTLEPVCKCNTTAGYYGQDPNACQLSENKQCKLPGYELKQDGSCDECPGGTYKNTHQFGRCLLQPRCQRPLVVDNPGDSAHRRTCKIPVTTPPDKIVTTRESTSAADIEYSTLSYSTFNVTASTNQTSPLIDSTNFEWINFLLGAVVVSVPLCVCCVIIKKKRKRKKLRQRHQNNEDGVNLIAKGMTQSLNRYQQGNGGNTHTSSCWIDKLKTKICPKTCRNSKAYEHVKTKTMNEEKTTMIGNKTSNIVYVDEIKGKVNSNDITVKENSNDIADNVDVNGTFLNMNGDKTTDKVNDDKTTEGMNGEKTAAKVNGDKTTEGMKGEETTAKVNDDKTTERRNDEETAAKVNDDKTTERMNDEETAAKVNDDKTTERRNDEETAATVNDDKTTERRNDEETAAKVNDDKTTERRNDEETAATVNDDKTTERRNDEETAAKVNDDKTTERRNDEETAAKVNDDKTTERRNDEETAAKVNDDKTTERRNDEETAAKVNDDKTTERRNDEETAAKVNDDKTTERRNDEETAAKVNDDKTTEIENCENTTTTSDANENHDTSNSSLDVNSFFSSGKTSSEFVDMHILKWSPSSSKGFIECTDTSGKRFKSIAIHNGSQGMILLKMKDIGKGYKFIFVSSRENSKIESYVEVGVEPVTNNFDLNTLLESGLSTLDFSSSDFVQNRPEEDLSSHRLQKGSLDQPNHMSLQHSQNQADSGISNTTPAECGKQEGGSTPPLSLGSFNNDEN